MNVMLRIFSIILSTTLVVILPPSPTVAAGDAMTNQTATYWLERWAEAMGGRSAIASINTVYTRADVKTSGLTGHYEEWLDMVGNRRGNLALGENVFKQESIFRGDSAFRKDTNGKVSAVQGVVYARELSGLYFQRFAQFFPERHAAEIVLTSTGAAANEIGLVITPANGERFTVYLDTSGGLPTRQTMKEGDRYSTTWMSDWRPVGGVLFPFQSRQGHGDDAYDVFLTISDVRINEAIDPALFQFENTVVRDATIATGAVSPDITIRLNANHVYVPVKVNGQGPYWFALDTGAGMTVLQRRTAEELNLSLSGALEGRGGGSESVDVALVSGVSFELPGVTVSDQRAAVIALGELEAIEGFSMDGILGYDFISRFVVQIDYQRRVLRLYDPEPFVAPSGVEPIPFTIEDNDPIVEATVTFENCPAVKGRFLLDSGKRSGVSISSPEVARLNLAACLQPTIEAPQGFGVGGQTKQLLGRLATFVIGSHTLNNLLVALSQDTSGATATTDFVGMIGGEILRRFTTTIDYSRYRLYLQPNDHLAEAEEYNMAGMILKSDPPQFERVFVHQVVPDSPAAQGGLQAGDELLSFDGKTLTGVSLEELRQMLLTHGRVLKIGWQRGDKSGTTTLTLHRLI